MRAIIKKVYTRRSWNLNAKSPSSKLRRTQSRMYNTKWIRLACRVSWAATRSEMILGDNSRRATNVYRLVTISGCHSGKDEGSGASLSLTSLSSLRASRYLSREGEGCSKRGRDPAGRPVDVWLLLKLKISIPIRTPGFIEAQFVSLLQDNTHSSRGQ